jgi:CubicO group peptidase (beta-lactamase class C family)
MMFNQPVIKKLGFLISFFVLTANASVGQNAAKSLDSLFTSLHNQEKFNGNVLFAENGVPVLMKSYGLADRKNKRPLNTKSIFELASVSKQFTAMGIVLLEKQGKLAFDDLMSRYIPELKFFGDITVRNLLNHTGGLPDYMAVLETHWDKTKIATNDDIIRQFALIKPKADFKPYQKYEYSNTGYALLATIIERVSKKTYGAFLSQYIFKPLGMKRTLVYRSRYEPRKIDNYALGYVQDSTGTMVLPDSFGKQFLSYYLDGIVGDGMVNSSIEDLLKWDQALYTDKLVDSTDKSSIFSGTKTLDGKLNNYGFGWDVSESKKYGKIISHSGGWAGYLTYIERDTDNRKTMIVLQNYGKEESEMPMSAARKLLYAQELASKKPNKTL